MHLLYSVTIQPLELAYKFLYLFLAQVTGTYGLSLFCLSLVSYAVLHPLKRLAASLQERERRVQAVLAPELAAIKIQSRGAERQARTAALYRRYAYHPLMALRSSAGILLQVPFIWAAYAMLKAFEPIRGQSAFFGLIPDLGAADGLIGGVNALPLLMTGVNLLAVLTTRGFNRREKLQGGLIALLFLILLYPAPASLLIYWTGNNILMLLENIIRGLARFLPAGAPRGAAAYKTGMPPSAGDSHETPTIAGFLKAVVPVCAAVFAIPSVKALSSYARSVTWWADAGGILAHKVVATTQQIAAILIMITATAWALRRVSRLPRLTRPWLRALIVGLSLWPLYIIGRFLAQSNVLGFHLDRLFYDRIILALGVCLAAGTDWRGCFTRCRNALAAGSIPLSFAFSSLTMVLTLGFLSPYALYHSSPDYFGVPFSQMLGGLLPYMTLFLFLCFLLRLALPMALRPWLACFWLGLALLVFLNSTVFTGDYGALDGVLLSNDRNLYGPLRGVTDLLVFLLIFLLVFAVYYFQAARIMLFCLQAACAVMLLSAAAAAFLDLEAGRRSTVYNKATPEPGGPLSLSKTHPNVLVFFLDMFTGGHVEDIFAEHADLLPGFAGFTWYPDTVAVGDMTTLSVPSLLGGQAFTPDRLNQRPDSTLADKFTEAAAVLPRAFGAKGYAVTYLHTPYPLNGRLLEHLSNGTPPRIVERLPESELLRRWKQIIIPGYSPLNQESFDHTPTEFVLLLSLFKASPHTLKGSLYNDALWLPDKLLPRLNKHFSHRTLYESAVFGLLPELAGTEADKPTLTIIYSELSHISWYLPKDSLIPVEDPYPATKGQRIKVDGLLPEHLYTETHIFCLLAAFFDWLRAAGVYDNTMIVLVSDHCHGDSRMLNIALGVDERGLIAGWREHNAYPGRPHALLMWKRFNDKAPFRQAPDLMSSMDVPALVCEAIGGCPDVERPDSGPQRVRFHYYDGPMRQIEVPGKKTYDALKKAVVRGTMFRKENWSHDEGSAD